MNTHTTTQRRTFDILNISEEEGVILRALLNFSVEGIKDKLQGDDLDWEEIMSQDTATHIGVALCDRISAMVDGVPYVFVEDVVD